MFNQSDLLRHCKRLPLLLFLPLTAALADAQFIDNADGTVTDLRTQLTWKRCAENQTWTGITCAGHEIYYLAADALNITSDFAGYSDWRLPSIDELRASLPYENRLFPNQPPSYIYWSSSPDVTKTALGETRAYWLKTMQFGDPSVVSIRIWKHADTDPLPISIYPQIRAAVRLVRNAPKTVTQQLAGNRVKPLSVATAAE